MSVKSRQQTSPDPVMHRGLSLYLDLVRFTAAMEVFLYHLSNPVGFVYHPLWAAFGHEAVIVFFVLSGYVISYTAKYRDRTVGRFAISRLTRVYSVAVPALLLTVTLDYLGYPLNPTLYEGFAPLHSPFLRFGISLLLLNETWISAQAFSNGPFWSLSYELAYYVIFASFFFFRGWPRLVLLATCLLLAGPRILLLFPIWLMGSWAFFETNSRNWRRSVHWALFLLPIPAAMWIYSAHKTVVPPGIDLGHSRQVLSDWYLGVLLVLHFLGAKNLGPVLMRALEWVSSPVRNLADYTFTLYMIHLPVILFVGAAVGVDKPWSAPAIVLAVGIVTALLGYFTEHQRHRLKRRVERLLAATTGGGAPQGALSISHATTRSAACGDSKQMVDPHLVGRRHRRRDRRLSMELRRLFRFYLEAKIK